MAKTSFRSVDEYIASQPDHVQAALRRIRGGIRKALPAADEVIRYQIPAYRLDGRTVLYFAGWREHLSLYPASDRLVAAVKELAPYKVSKGTIRFPLSEPIPVRLIGRIARLRAAEEAERAKAKGPAKRRTSARRPRRRTTKR